MLDGAVRLGDLAAAVKAQEGARDDGPRLALRCLRLLAAGDERGIKPITAPRRT